MSTKRMQLTRASLLAVMAVLGSAAVALSQDRAEVIISDTLEPTRLEVASGTVVTWRNSDSERHRVRSREGPVEFDSGNLEPGETFVFTFIVEGTYAYHDERNDEDSAYLGTVVVGPADADAPLPTSAEVTLIDETFQPTLLEVATGATVEWVHIDGDDQHTVTSTDGAFNSGIMENGQTFSQTFEAAGTYPYFCGIHPEMVGTLTVSDPGDGEPPVEGPVVSTPPVEEPVVSTPPAVEPPAGAAVGIVDLTFEPPTIEVAAGTTVTWSNDDVVGHTVTATDGAFDSGNMITGETFSQSFETPGSVDYFCAIHPSMQGTVVVTEPTAEEPTATAPPAEEPPAEEPPAEASVDVVDFTFEPPSIEVAAGTTVTWSNDDVVGHTVTATDGAFDSGNMITGETFSQSFETPGSVDYFCAIHPSMQGTVVVSEPVGG